MNNETDNLKKRLIYRSQYRGTKEMDKLIGNFVQTNIDKLNNIQLKELEKFLEIDDDTLYKYYTGLKFASKMKQSEILKLFKKYKLK